MNESKNSGLVAGMKKVAAWGAVAFALYSLANFPIPGTAAWFLMPFEDKLPVIGNLDEVLAGVGLAWALGVLKLNPITALQNARAKKKTAIEAAKKQAG